MISVEGLTVEFGGFTLFDDVSFVVNKKDRIALVGKNGAGKSTMLKIFAGLQSPTAGNISVPKELTIGYLPQQMQLTDTRTVREEAEQAFDQIHQLEKQLERLTLELAERTDYESESYHDLIDKVTHLTEHFQMMGGNSYQAELEREALKIEEEKRLQQVKLEKEREMLKNQDLIARAEQLKQQVQKTERRSLEQILEDAQEEISRPSAGIYVIDDVYSIRKKTEKAIKSYAYEGDGEYGKYNDDPLVLVDTTTLFKNAENGLYLTYSELYCKDMLSKRFVIRLSEIRSIRFDKSDSKLSINGKEVLYVPQDNLKTPMVNLANALKTYIEQ